MSPEVAERFSAEIERRGALDVLRNGLKDTGCKSRLAYARPASGLNEETRRLHAANLFAAVRQLRHGTKNGKSLDLVLFLNGLPVFTAELKNPLTGQDVEEAVRRYKTAARASRSSSTGAASRTSPWTRTWSAPRRTSRARRPASCPSTRSWW